jgi:phosphoglycerate dehydrogenase-like enzyme
VLYAVAPPRDLARAPSLRWVQVHMAGVNSLYDHPLYTQSALPVTTTSGVHAAAVAEYAIAMLLALAHRVPIGYGSIGRELARIAKTAFGMTILACKRDPAQRIDTGYALAGTGDPEGRLPDAWFAPEKLVDLLARADVVVKPPKA